MVKAITFPLAESLTLFWRSRQNKDAKTKSMILRADKVIALTSIYTELF